MLFHFSFLKDINRKEKWINATSRKDWVPLKQSTIYYDHFDMCDILITKMLTLTQKFEYHFLRVRIRELLRNGIPKLVVNQDSKTKRHLRLEK